MAAGRARRAAREAMRREFMMAGGPIDVYSRLRRTGAPSAVWQPREGFPTFRVQPTSWRSRAFLLSHRPRDPTSAALLEIYSEFKMVHEESIYHVFEISGGLVPMFRDCLESISFKPASRNFTWLMRPKTS